jgi:hypothetical protein
MKISKTKLKEMVRKIVKTKLQESFMKYGASSLADLNPNEMSQVKQWIAAGGDPSLPPELLDKLTHMYVDEMPYGVQKGRVGGTPEEWLFDKLADILEPALEETPSARVHVETLTRYFNPSEMNMLHQWHASDGDLELQPELLAKLMQHFVAEMPLDVQQGKGDVEPEEWLWHELDGELGLPGWSGGAAGSRPLQESKTVKISPNQLKEMIRGIISTEVLTEEADKKKKSDDKMPEKWVQYMKDVEDMLGDVVEKAKKLHEEGEDLKTEERELNKVANAINSARGNQYEYIDERSSALKGLISDLSVKLEIWKTKYGG